MLAGILDVYRKVSIYFPPVIAYYFDEVNVFLSGKDESAPLIFIIFIYWGGGGVLFFYFPRLRWD